MATPFADLIASIYGSNLKRHCKLWEASGTNLVDATGNADQTANNGLSVGQSALSNDAGAKSVLFDGVDDYARQTGGLLGISTASPLTFGCLFRTSNATQAACLISAGRYNSGYGHFMFYIEGGQLKCGWCNTGGGSWSWQENGPTGAADGAVHLALVTSSSGSDLRMYLDNTEVARSQSINITDGATCDVRLGIYSRNMTISPPDAFDGGMEQFFAANQSTTAGNVSDLVNALGAAAGPRPRTNMLGGFMNLRGGFCNG